MGVDDAGEVKVFIFVFEDMLYSSTVTMAVECFFRRLRALWGGCVVRKYWLRSVQGVVGGQDDVAVFKRM